MPLPPDHFHANHRRATTSWWRPWRRTPPVPRRAQPDAGDFGVELGMELHLQTQAATVQHRGAATGTPSATHRPVGHDLAAWRPWWPFGWRRRMH